MIQVTVMLGSHTYARYVGLTSQDSAEMLVADLAKAHCNKAGIRISIDRV